MVDLRVLSARWPTALSFRVTPDLRCARDLISTPKDLVNSSARSAVAEVLLEIALLTNEIAEWNVLHVRQKANVVKFTVARNGCGPAAEVALNRDGCCESIRTLGQRESVYRPLDLAPLGSRNKMIYSAWQRDHDPPMSIQRVELRVASKLVLL